MWDSVRSTWPVDGPSRDSLLPGSCEQYWCSATFSPLWSSNLVDFSSCCPLSSIQSLSDGKLPVIIGMPVHLVGKQGQLSPRPDRLLLEFFQASFHPSFYMFASWEAFDH